MATSVKICGIKNEATLRAAVDAGARYVGFVHYPKSPRHIEPQAIIPLIALLPRHVVHVSVVVDPDDALLAELHKINNIRLGHVQLHGHESVERIQEIKQKFEGMSIIKAIPVENEVDISPEKIHPFMMAADMLLFDAKPPKDATLTGGNGISFDWQLLGSEYIKDISLQIPWFLSGGLTPENVADAIRISGAQMVDVSSGVESSAGVKDNALIKRFIERAN